MINPLPPLAKQEKKKKKKNSFEYPDQASGKLFGRSTRINSKGYDVSLGKN